MRAAFRQTANVKLHLMAAAALAKGGHQQAMSAIRKSLTDDNPEVVKIAAWILGRIGDRTDIPRLRRALPNCPDELSQAYVEHALAVLGDVAGLTALARNLESDDPAVRTYAATFAGDAHAVQVAMRLETMLNDEHADARIRAAQSLLVFATPTK